MNTQMHLFDPPERFVCGTVGEPGDRTFFLQARSGSRLVSVSLEKSQVQAITERLAAMLREVRGVEPMTSILEIARDSEPLEGPIEEEFRVGLIGILYDAENQVIQLDLQEIPQQSTAEDFEGDDLQDFAEDEGDRRLLRVRASLGQIKAFIRRADAVISAGRPPCPFCGGPIDARGHLCPRANGYRR